MASDSHMRLVVTLAALLLRALTPSVAEACDPVQLPTSGPSGIALFVATVAPDRGEHLRADMLTGRAGTDDIAREEAVLVPWSHGSDCRPVPWNPARDGGGWSPPHEPAVYTGWIRPPDRWIDGLPTIDVHWAHLQPVWWPAKAVNPPLSGALLTTAEFFDFFRALRTDEELRDRQVEALIRVRAWASAHQTAVSREPARSMLAQLYWLWAAATEQTAPSSTLMSSVRFDTVRPEHLASVSNGTCSLPAELPTEPDYAVTSPSGVWSATVQRTDGARVPYDQAQACVRLRDRSGRLRSVTVGDRTTSAGTVFRDLRLQWINDRLLYIFVDVGHAAGVGQLLDIEDGKWLYAKTESYVRQ